MSPYDSSGSFELFCQLCDDIESKPKYTDKTEAVKDFVEDFEGDVFLLCKFLICKHDRRVYNIREKQLVRILSRYLDCSHRELIDDLEKGDHSQTCKDFFMRYKENYRTKSVLTLKMVDQYLEQLTTATKEDDQLDIISNFCDLCTPEDLRYVTKLMDHDLKINIGEKFVLNALHPQAYEAYKNSNDLKLIIERWKNHTLDSIKGKGAKDFRTGISVMTPIKPMLARKVTSLAECFKRAPGGIFAEIKYDGERIQIHKDGDKWRCYSRNLRDVQEWKVKGVQNYIEQAAPQAKSVVLDGELLLMDTKTHQPLPFGTLAIHKKNNFADATVCVFIFDILFLNGEVLLNYPIEERRKTMLKYVKPIPDHVELSELYEINEEADLQKLMKRATCEGLEGLMVKALGGVYSPNSRHWFKLKKDYFEMADTVDLVVLGAYYGKGLQARSTTDGLLSIFLMGAFEKKSKQWKTVCKVGNGLDEDTISKLQKSVMSNFTKISKDPSQVPDHFDIHRQNVPDFIVKDIKKAPVWEIKGASFSVSTKHTVHTAAGISIRFPRIERIRDDKDYKSANTVEEIVELASLDPVSYMNNANERAKSSSRTGSRSLSRSPARGDSPGSSSPPPRSAPKKAKEPTAKKEAPKEDNEEDPMDEFEDKPTPAQDKPKKRTREALEEDASFINEDTSHTNPPTLQRCSSAQQAREEMITRKADKEERNQVIVQFAADDGQCDLALFVQMAKKYKKPSKKYYAYHQKNDSLSQLGSIQSIKVEQYDMRKLFVVTAICVDSASQLITLKAFQKCLGQILSFAKMKHASVHMVLDEDTPWNSDVDSFCQMVGKATSGEMNMDVYIYTDSDDSGDAPAASPARKKMKTPSTAVSIFTNVNAVLDGFDKKTESKLHDLITQNGGKVSAKWSAKGSGRTTHLICAKPAGKVYDSVDQLGGVIVSSAWVTKSSDAGRRLNELQYEFNEDGTEVDPTQKVVSIPMEYIPPSDVDVESPASSSSSKKKSGAPIDQFPIFHGKKIMVDVKNVKKPEQLIRYLTAYDCPKIVKNWSLVDSSFHIVLTDGTWSKEMAEAVKTAPKLRVLSSLWAWDSINTKTLLPPGPYMVKKSR